ncbi:hypothetical protein EDC96DRAFT_457192, partial [Choanephora cucurbitarum]
MKKGLLIYFCLTFYATLSIAQSTDEEDKEQANTKASREAKVRAAGALLVGSAGIMVPDASAEKPMIIDNEKDQPLCKPQKLLKPKKSLQAMKGYEYFVLTNEILKPRKIVIDKANHILVISHKNGVYSVRMDECGNADIKQILGNDMTDLPVGDGLAVAGGYLYVSTTNSVYQFPYSDGQHSALLKGRKVVKNIHSIEDAESPDIAIDPFGYAYLPRSVNQLSNPMNENDAIIKKFNFRSIPKEGFDYDIDGELFAKGTNTYGVMGFDTQARLWGLNSIPTSDITISGVKTLYNIYANTIAEELNMYATPGAHYGFPYCMTEFNLGSSKEEPANMGKQWGHPGFMREDLSLDEYCQVEQHNTPPSWPIESNLVASSVQFFMGTFCSVGDDKTLGTSVGLPCNWTDTPLVANHGNPSQPEGHSVVRLPYDDLGHKARWDKKPEVILAQKESCKEKDCFSPYGLAIDKYGRLFVSSDTTNEIIIVNRVYSKQAIYTITAKLEAETSKEDEGEEEVEGVEDTEGEVQEVEDMEGEAQEVEVIEGEVQEGE